MLALLLGVLGVAVWLLFPRSASASSAQSYDSSFEPYELPPLQVNVLEWYAMNNLTAFLGVIRYVESGDKYNVIAGGDSFSDYREHPFVLDPSRRKPLGTTASGAYQMVVGTWKMARDALGLTDFSPASQDKAAVWILQNKRRGSYDAVVSGDFNRALVLLRLEWEAFDKMLVGNYPISIVAAQSRYTSNGGTLA